MKPYRPLILFVALSLACNLPGGLSTGATPAPAATLRPTPSAIPTEPAPAAATPTAAPENSPADLTGPARSASAPGEWPLYDSGNSVFALLAQGDSLWAGASGGIVRWEPATGQYERFTAANGLNLTQVFDLTADSTGQVWAAGREGLATYDGVTWRHITQSEMGLPGVPLRAVAVDPEGSVWAGGDEYFDYSGDPFYIPQADETQGGLARLQNGTWEVFDVVGDGLLSNQINDLAIGPDGRLWVACGQAGSEPTDGGVMQYDAASDAWTEFEGRLDGYAFSDLAFDAAGVLWVAGRRGINRVTADGTESFDLWNVHSLAAGPDGVLWIGAQEGLHQYSQGALTPVNLDTLPITINAIAIAAGGEVWVGTGLWLARLAEDSLERHYTTDGPLNNASLKLAFASDGSLWVRTQGAISRLTGGQWEHFLDERAAVEAAYPWELNREALWPVDSQGGLWLAEGDRLARYDGAEWADVTPAQGPVFRLAPDPNEGMWGVGDSLLRFLDGAWQTVASFGEFDFFFSVADMLVDAQGQAWIASAVPYVDGGGIARWDGGWTTYTEADGLAGNATTDLALGPDGQIWAAHPVRGLSRFDGQAWQVEVAKPRALGLEADGFASVHFAPDGTTWFRLESHCGFEGTCFNGLAHHAGDQWTPYHVQPGGLPTETVFDLAVTEAGQVWLGTNLGVVRAAN